MVLAAIGRQTFDAKISQLCSSFRAKSTTNDEIKLMKQKAHKLRD